MRLPQGALGSLYVDGKLIHRATPQLTSLKAGRLGTLNLHAVDGLVAGHILEMISPAGLDRYQLTGTADALSKTVECVNTGVALEQGGASGSLSYQFRIPFTVDVGFMNMRSNPSMASPVVATVPAGERGLQKVGECRASDDVTVKSPWCYMQWHGMTGWISSSGLMEEVATMAPLPVRQPTGSPTATAPPNPQALGEHGKAQTISSKLDGADHVVPPTAGSFGGYGNLCGQHRLQGCRDMRSSLGMGGHRSRVTNFCVHHSGCAGEERRREIGRAEPGCNVSHRA